MTPELAAIIARGYALMPAPSQEQPSEFWEKRESARRLRIVQSENDYNNSGRI